MDCYITDDIRLAPVSKEGEHEEEELDDVNVEADCRHGIVVNTELVLSVVPSHNELGVVDQVERE